MLRHELLKKCCLPVLSLGAVLLLQGCNTMGGQPEMVEARISPDSLRPGDEALITVELKDKNKVVSGIEGVVQEDQRITFDLNDAGEQSDSKPGDGVWTFGVKVPFQAPEGQFMLELTAYREDGNAVSIKSKDGGVTALQKTVPLVIQADGTAAPAAETSDAPAVAAPAEAAPTVEAPAAVETDSQAGESPSEASDNAEPAAAAEAPTAGDEPKRNPKSMMEGDETAPEADAAAEPEKESRAERKKRKKEEASAVEEAQPVEEAAPADDTAPSATE